MNNRVLRWLAGAKAAALILALAACGGGGGDDDDDGPPPAATASISGVALASADAKPVVDARASAAGVEVRSGADGRFQFTALPAGRRQVVKVEAEGYADGFLALDLTAGKTAKGEVRLVKVAATVQIDPAQANTVSVPGTSAQVQLPAAGLQGPGGEPPRGQVSVDLTPIDPGADPASMPGDYTTSNNERMESFGALQVRLRDADGRRLNLKPGTTAQIRIPLASRSADAPPTVPLFYFDEQAGRWVQEGEATLKGSGANRYYEGSVKHFTYWNADIVADTIYVHGCVKDQDGRLVDGAWVQSEGVDYSGNGFAETDAQGRFSVPIRRNSRALVNARDFLSEASASVLVGPSGVDITLPECLVLPLDSVAPSVVVQPTTPAATVGDRVFLYALAQGSWPLQYQWLRNGVEIAGATYPWLELPSVTPFDHGARFTVRVSNRVDTVVSDPAVLTVTAAQPPKLLVQPFDQTAAVGETARFAVVAEGGQGLRYQWRRNGTALPGATQAFYQTPPLTEADNGALYSVVVSNAQGDVTSQEAKLTITADSQEQKANLIRLVTLAFEAYQAAAAPMLFIDEEMRGKSAAAVCSSGSASATLSGASLPVGQPLPLSGELAASFQGCVNAGTRHNGSAKLSYNITSLHPQTGSMSSQVTALRLQDVDSASPEAQDITVTGTVGATYTGSSTADESTQRSVITLHAGTTLLSATSGLTASFQQSTLVSEVITPKAGGNPRWSTGYQNVSFTAGGASYTADGTLEFGGTSLAVTGEVIVKRNGAVLGRMFGSPAGLQIEVDGKVQPF
ncbi:hypothetical protein [Caldimonas brevitalea]|uniref:Phage protein n=1 Tax=Caldimonas brevitalea TaxID=413882 RepID=A0A0G3BIU0_9BURK|nr:hypothetical protein [Caldimonas brevitalea]AKJ29272.1 phage protein [Caldimonas brevitalea]